MSVNAFTHYVKVGCKVVKGTLLPLKELEEEPSKIIRKVSILKKKNYKEYLPSLLKKIFHN